MKAVFACCVVLIGACVEADPNYGLTTGISITGSGTETDSNTSTATAGTTDTTAATSASGESTTGDSEASTGVDPTSTGSETTGSTGTVGPQSVEYDAVVAECSDTTNLDPDLCEANSGAGNLNVDANDNQVMAPNFGFVRFDLDDAFAGKNVTQVTLRMVTTDDPGADSDMTGEIWEVEAFDLADLMGAQPATVGNAAIAPDQGAVLENETVEWPIPMGQISPSTPVYLGVFPTTGQGVSYWNLDGAEPPKLVVDFE